MASRRQPWTRLTSALGALVMLAGALRLATLPCPARFACAACCHGADDAAAANATSTADANATADENATAAADEAPPSLVPVRPCCVTVAASGAAAKNAAALVRGHAVFAVAAAEFAVAAPSFASAPASTASAPAFAPTRLYRRHCALLL